MTYDDQNIFARILRGEIPAQKIHEDDFTLAFHDLKKQAPVHALVIPKGRFVDFADFTANASAAESQGFYRAVAAVAAALGVAQTGYRLIGNIGRHSHQEVPHYHLHILGGEPLGGMLVK